jgi:trans-aconitate 2-methyltransferase
VWDPATYGQFDCERARPFDDLLARVRAEGPRQVVDLGCGPGGRTASLLRRWPTARVEGLDSSPEMIDAAAPLVVPGRLSFRLADLRTWQPTGPVDVLLANAVLQWVPGHLGLLPRLVAAVAAGGWFAFQVPGNFDEPSHRLLMELRQSPRWRGRVGEDASRSAAVHPPATYLSVLAEKGLRVDCWETTYLHLLPGEDAVLDWTKGTALRPVFAVLDGPERQQFVDEYAALLRAAYPRQPFGTVLPFRRIFVVAHRPA